MQSFNLMYNSVICILLSYKLITSHLLYYLKHGINIKIAMSVHNFGTRYVPQRIPLHLQ